MLDVFTLVVPDNERYYIRTLRRSLDKISCAEQKAELRAFFHQESLHGSAHRSYWRGMSEHGTRVERFARLTASVLYEWLEPVLPHRVHVSNVAAIEHINAYLGHVFLAKRLLRNSDPEMRRLFEWHFAEEIEHKGVAFDALAVTYPGYFTRVAGGTLSFAIFHTILVMGTMWLLACRGELFRMRTLSDLYRFWISDGVLLDTLHHIARYMRPSFHPWQLDDYFLAREFLATFELDQARPKQTTEPT